LDVLLEPERVRKAGQFDDASTVVVRDDDEFSASAAVAACVLDEDAETGDES